MSSGLVAPIFFKKIYKEKVATYLRVYTVVETYYKFFLTVSMP